MTPQNQPTTTTDEDVLAPTQTPLEREVNAWIGRSSSGAPPAPTSASSLEDLVNAEIAGLGDDDFPSAA